MTDIAITLTQEHIDAFCPAEYLVQTEKQTDEDYAAAKLALATSKMCSFADEVRDAYNIQAQVDAARKSAIAENAKLEKAVASIVPEKS